MNCTSKPALKRVKMTKLKLPKCKNLPTPLPFISAPYLFTVIRYFKNSLIIHRKDQKTLMFLNECDSDKDTAKLYIQLFARK